MEGEFYGTVGIDIRLDSLQALIDQVDLFDKTTGKAALISHNGTLAAVTGQPELVGQSGEVLHKDFVGDDLETIQKGEQSVEYQGNQSKEKSAWL